MRNWNVVHSYLVPLIVLCFYSTYEELKQVIDKVVIYCFYPFLQYLWGIETDFQLDCTLFPFPRFYSTYEELKLCKSHL